MKSTNKLKKVYDQAKDPRSINYGFEYFIKDAKEFIKDIKKSRVICSMKVSRSGMTRRFNWDKYNMLINICYNQKQDYNAVRVGGCGMDMHWHTLFRTCEDLVTKGEMEKWGLNLACSHQKIL